MTSAPPDSDSSRFHVGTLKYTTAGLAMLFVWLLWGNFCFQLMEMVAIQVLPLKLQGLNASNIVTAVILSTIPNAMNFVVNPIVSTRSDRYRSRWGRRLPFLFWATPPLTLFLILMGYSDSLARTLNRIPGFLAHFSPTTLALVLVGLFTILFQFFNMIINSIYYFLFNDVVPQAFIGRFLSLFRVIASGATVLFEFFVFPYSRSYMRGIFLGAAAAYFVSFMLMCLNVKEGQYPAPATETDRQPGIFASARTYFVECFNSRFYWDFFLSNTFWAAAACTGPFMVYLYLSLGMSLGQLGKVAGWSAVISVLLLYPAGMMVDRIHPVRIMLLSTAIIVVLSQVLLVWLFFDPSPRISMVIYTTYSFTVLPATILYTAGSLPMYMRLLPKQKFGQFCSADAMIRSIAVIGGGPLLGLLLDALKWKLNGNSHYYRYAPIWTTVLQALSLLFLYRVYRYWKMQKNQTVDGLPEEPDSRRGIDPEPFIVQATSEPTVS